MLEGKLSEEWRVWLSYSAGNKNQAVYGNNFIKLAPLRTWEDFGYLWTQSPISDPYNFFSDPFTGKYNKYEIEQQPRKIESINFFKRDIEPTWEFGDNNKGGYFNFSVPRDSADSSKIYQAIVYMAIGNAISLSDRINGVRLVDTAAKNQYRCRVQIWVDFRQCEQNLDLLRQYGKQLEGYFNETGIGIKQIRFFNIDTDNKNKLISESKFRQNETAKDTNATYRKLDSKNS